MPYDPSSKGEQVTTDQDSNQQTARVRRISQAFHALEEEHDWTTLEQTHPRESAATRVALVNLDAESQKILQECFGQFGIETVSIISDNGEFLSEEKYQGCALKLHSTSAAIMEAARSSVLNRHTMVYGISGNPISLIRFQKYGINVILDSPLVRATVMEVVKATHSLLKNQIRRYVRIPLLTLVQLNVGGDTFAVNSRQISPAGMSLMTKQKLAVGQNGKVSFTLPNTLPVTTEVVVCWVQESHGMIGVRFESGQSSSVVKSWMEEYLAIA